ncbi:glycerol-3-phosphate acyltransferase [Chloroflexota bacterium]
MGIEFGLLIVGSYLLGSVPTAYLAARWSRGMDIRQYGDGNVGATNLMRLTSKRIAIPVVIFDLGKGALMIWIAQLLGLGIPQQVMVGLAAIIGHNWPVFLRFNGGRGIFTSLGVISILAPWLGLIVLVIAYGLAPFHQLAVGVFLGLVFAPTSAWFLSQTLEVIDKLPIALGFLAIFLIAVVRRLTAPRTIFTSSVPSGQLLVNRLLFDRDIRNRETWINQKQSQPEKQGED